MQVLNRDFGEKRPDGMGQRGRMGKARGDMRSVSQEGFACFHLRPDDHKVVGERRGEAIHNGNCRLHDADVGESDKWRASKHAG